MKKENANKIPTKIDSFIADDEVENDFCYLRYDIFLHSRIRL